MNSVALMVALMAVPDSASFGGGCGGCCDPCGKTGLFHGRIRAFFAKCFAKCRAKHACWSPPSGGCCGAGGFDAGGFDGMAMGGMPFGGMPMGGEMMGGMPMGGEMVMGGMPMGGMPMNGGVAMAMGGPGQSGGYPVVMNQQFVQNGPTVDGQQGHGAGVSAYPTQMPSAQGGFVAPPSQTWLANPQIAPQATPPVLNNPTPVRVAPPSSVPPIPVPTPIPPTGSGASLPQGAFPGTTPATAVIAAYATGGEDFAPAKLRFQVPTGAVVYVDGQKVDGSGPVRKFHTPTLPRGKTFFYEFKAEVEVNGVKVVEEKVLPVCAGDDLNETFAKLTAAAVAKK